MFDIDAASRVFSAAAVSLTGYDADADIHLGLKAFWCDRLIGGRSFYILAAER